MQQLVGQTIELKYKCVGNTNERSTLFLESFGVNADPWALVYSTPYSNISKQSWQFTVLTRTKKIKKKWTKCLHVADFFFFTGLFPHNDAAISDIHICT